MMRLGIIADTHLPTADNTEKERVFDWALEEARRRKLDCLLGAGDLTSNGMFAAAERVRLKLEKSQIPFALTPGNADLRERNDREKTAELLTVESPIPGIFMLDSSKRKISENDMMTLQHLPRGTVVVTHCPPESLPFSDQYLINNLLRNGCIGLYIAGHLHADRVEGNLNLIRGLDPDKASGGPPALTVFEYANGCWKRENIPCPFADPVNWTLDEKEDFCRWLGISGMSDPISALELAAQHKISVFEYRFDEANEYSRRKLCEAVKTWRSAGGKELLATLPFCTWRNGKLSGIGRMQRAVEVAMEIGCNQIHAKIPQISMNDFNSKEIRDSLAGEYSALLEPLKKAHCKIAFENSQMMGKSRNTELRNYGCLPDEALKWCRLMREWMNDPSIGFHLNIGNARNNSPFPNRFTLSQWYAATGKECIGYSLHQVVRDRQDKPLRENFPLDTFFGKQISLSSFTMAWQNGSLSHAPMILDIKDSQSLTCRTKLHSLLFFSR